MVLLSYPDGRRQVLAAGCHLITRQKISGPMTHFGVLFTGVSGGDRVFEMTEAGVRIGTLAQFALGRSVKVVRSKSSGESWEVMRRAQDLLDRRPKYSAGYNCEHAAREVFDGVSKSEQLNLGLVVGAVVGIVLLGRD
jgi:hypothetical protein